MTTTTAIAEAIQELDLYADTEEARISRELARLLFDLDENAGQGVH